jgi:hypothetical protein
MTNLECMEAAAKAAGLNVRRGTGWQSGMLFVGDDARHGWVTGREWNPLQDDGDALRLAVARQLHAARSSSIQVQCWAEKAPFDSDEPGCDTHRAVSECWFGPDMRKYAERYGQNWREDQLSATRLVIVLAASKS